ncbi:exodeoxyribonuclease V subunit alpha [Aliidiomarina sp. Khilg15.8]
MSNNFLRDLEDWQNAGWIRQIDLALARFVSEQQESDELVCLLTALVSYQVGRGHVCLDLHALLTHPQQVLNLPPPSAQNPTQTARLPAHLFNGLSLTDCQQRLSQSDAVGSGPGTTPLVLIGNDLYLRRYWQHEEHIAGSLRARMTSDEKLDVARVKGLLQDLFVEKTDTNDAPNWQKLACANAVRSRFSVITGGPGTGKTYTVVRLLALLQKLHAQPPRVLLAAPTGKAAARLKESINNALSELCDEQKNPQLSSWKEALNAVTSDSSTLHKMLGVQRGTRAFRHHRDNPLHADIVIVDEASMIDIEMMAALLDALAPSASLILLGDKDQLASVEAGAVLGQLCAGAQAGGYWPQTFEFLQNVSQPRPLPQTMCEESAPQRLQHVVMLRQSRRFTEGSGIGLLAQAVNNANPVQVRQILHQASAGDFADIARLDCKDPNAPALRDLCREGFRRYWQVIQAKPPADAANAEVDAWARKVLEAFSSFQLLTPLREGELGVDGLNSRVRDWLSQISGREQWYEGRPVMVTQNDYSLNLRNGDIGMVLQTPQEGHKRVVFIDGDGEVRWVLPSRLTSVDTVFAMTVHKSQGSEFSHTVMVLPDRDNPVLSKELLYTGLTRARDKLTLALANPDVLTAAVQRQIDRHGGLHLQ